MVRLYFNKRGDSPWSVDTGPGTQEFTTQSVLFEAVGETIFDDRIPQNDEKPRAWIEFKDGFMTRNQLGDAITIWEWSRPREE